MLQLAELVAMDIKPHILRYLNTGETGPATALEAMRSKYGIRKLVRPNMLAKLMNMRTAPREEDIFPRTDWYISFARSS